MGPAHPHTPARRLEPAFAPLRGASLAGVCVRQAGTRTTMPTPKRTAERTPGDPPAADRRETGEHAEEFVPAGGPLPAPAGRFGITDPRCWLDLCGYQVRRVPQGGAQHLEELRGGRLAPQFAQPGRFGVRGPCACHCEATFGGLSASGGQPFRRRSNRRTDRHGKDGHDDTTVGSERLRWFL
jgi:hypothetical protein